jgi:hypothetical protein
MLIRGDGVEKDVAQALAWYEKAAAQDHIKAILKLAQLYLEGVEVIQDEAKGLEWTRQAAALGDGKAQEKLSEMYLKGIGTAPNRPAAVQWALKASGSIRNPRLHMSQGHGAHVKIPRSELDAVLADMPKLYNDLRTVPFFKDGKAEGFKLLSIKRGSIFERLGLKRGDVWMKVNGNTLNLQNSFNLFNQLKNETQFVFDIERRGDPIKIEIEITS